MWRFDEEMNSSCHSERSEAMRNAVEGSRGESSKVTERDPSTSLGMTKVY